MRFWHKEVRYREVVKVPDQATALAELAESRIVVVMPGETAKSVKFHCPCGCGEVLTVNLMASVAKAWRLTVEPEKGASLYPSVWRDTGCQSHFILRRNVAWLMFGSLAPAEASRFWSETWKRSDAEAGY